MAEREFSTDDKLQVLKVERKDCNKYWYDVNKANLVGIVNDRGALEKHPFLRAKHTGSWMSVYDNTVTGKVLDAT